MQVLTYGQDIENLDTLGNLEELWLGKNKITELKVENPFMISVTRSKANVEYLTSLQPQDSINTIKSAPTNFWDFWAFKP